MTDLSRTIAVKPIIKYPREAQVGKTYLMTIELQPEEGFEWRYDEEEYPIYCTVDSELFSSQPVGEPVIVLHRFGGSYGEARFLLTTKESQQGKIRVTLVNRYGVLINAISLEVSKIIDKNWTVETDEPIESGQLVLIQTNQNNYEYVELQSATDTNASKNVEGKNWYTFCRGTAKIEIPETGEIFEVEPTDLEWESYCADPDRAMGEEFHHYASIEIESKEGDYQVEATWNVWEYPVGAVNYVEPEIVGGRLIEDFDEYFIPHQIDDEQPRQLSPNFFAYDDAWVGRDDLIRELSDRIRGNCRLLILVGITGIGKTALGERLAVEVSDWFKNDWSYYHQENFDDEQQTSDFASVAARWLEKWGEPITSDDRKDPQQLLHRLIIYLRENRYLIQINSVENILQGNEEEGWNDFKDEWWLRFFESYLRAESCESRFILTSQDLPEQLEEAGTRVQKFWYCQPLSGLEKSEQIALFEKTELDVSPDSTSRTYLERIGHAYEGHPLALRVIAGEIKSKPFEGNVLAYWNRYGNEVEDVERAIAEVQEGFSVGANDRWQLDRFTKTLRRNVRSPLNRTFARLKEDARWAYILLCETSVYRCAVPEDFWLSHLEDWDRNEEEQRAALDVLRDRYLIEEFVDSDQYLLRQHNLIRSIALEHLKNLDTDEIADVATISSTRKKRSLLARLGLEEIIPSSAREQTHYFSVVNWLTKYQPNPSSTNIDKVRGYLEAFYHLCELQSWENANQLLSLQVNTSTNQKLLEQLGVWGYYSEQISLCEKLLGKLNQVSDFRLRSCLGNAAYIHGDYNLAIQYFQQSLQDAIQIHEQDAKGSAFNNLGTVYNVLGNYSEAIEYYQQALAISIESQNSSSRGKALSSLGIIYSNLGNYSQAINYYQQALSITREVGDLLEEGYTLGNLGLVHNFLGNYEQAIMYCQQSLAISQQIGDRYGEENVLGNLGIAYASLADYTRAVECHQYQLMIAREIGDRRGEGIALSRLGSSLINLHDYSNALSHLESSLQVLNEIGDRASQANALKVLAELYLELGQINAAHASLNQALEIAEELDIPLVQEIQNLAASIRED
jgi:tetratricopeptide (TPR) repeat protein